MPYRFKFLEFNIFRQGKAVVLFLFYFCAIAAKAQNGYQIEKITIVGNQTFSKSELLEKTNLATYNFLQRTFLKKEPVIFNENLMELDIERMTRFYQTEGFPFVEVQVDSLATNHKKQKVEIYIKIEENTPIFFGEIGFDIESQSISEEKKDSLLHLIKKHIVSKNGRRFRDKDVHEDKSRIEQIFINSGYVYVQVDHLINLSLDSYRADVVYVIRPFEICFFGKTEIVGNQNIKESLIRRQLAYTEGEIYSNKKLDKTRKQLFDLQLFRVASLQPQIDASSTRNSIPVKLTIEETPQWNAQIGLGYGTEDQFRTFLDLSFHSLWGDASRFHLYAKHSALEPYHFSLSWIQPQLFSKNISMRLNPFLRRQAEPGFDIRTYGLNLPFGYSFSDKINLTLSYYLENIKQYSEVDNLELINPESKDFLYNKSGLLTTFQYNNAFPQINPERGEIISIGIKSNGYLFGSDFDYTKIWIDTRKYLQINNFSCAARLMGGTVFSSNVIEYVPVEDRFYSGGSNSVRGWSRWALGPKRDDGSPLGGKSNLELSLEIRHPLFWLLESAVFLDAGNVWASSFHFPLDKLAYSAGTGLRIKTPVGAIRLDISVPLWNEKKSVQVFLNVGQAF